MIWNVSFLCEQLEQSRCVNTNGRNEIQYISLRYCICSIFWKEVRDCSVNREISGRIDVSTAERGSFVTGDTRRCALLLFVESRAYVARKLDCELRTIVFWRSDISTSDYQRTINCASKHRICMRKSSGKKKRMTDAARFLERDLWFNVEVTYVHFCGYMQIKFNLSLIYSLFS